ncbi:MAG: transcriptional regulator PpsR [Gemmatimonadota bacterium]
MFDLPLTELIDGHEDLLEQVVAGSSDLAVLLDEQGTIEGVHLGTSFAGEDPRSWIGSAWEETALADTRWKIGELLRKTLDEGVSDRRQVNLLFPSGAKVPVRYRAFRLPHCRRVLALGLDLRDQEALQRRLVEAQQTLERDYWRLRQVQTRYRLIFEVASEPLLILGGPELTVESANAAAVVALQAPLAELRGRALRDLLPTDMRSSADDALTRVRRDARATDVGAEALGLDVLRLTPLLAGAEGAVLVQGLSSAGRALPTRGALDSLAALEAFPDGVVVTDLQGVIRYANPAFAEFVEAPLSSLGGESLDRWLGRPGADLAVVRSALKATGRAKLIHTALLGDLGSELEVELSAARLEDPEGMLFAIRDVGRRLVRPAAPAQSLDRAVESLTPLVGQVTLPHLVRETSGLVERHFIQAALEVTGGNRSAAAELLGLSRQTLYAKLRTHSIESGETESD